MRFLLLFLLVIVKITTISCVEENCVEKSTDSCSHETEYNKYITCLEEGRRHKRSVGCNLQQESCEYFDCSNCQESCDVNCEDCVCPNQCRNCCSEVCNTNLCCHKTCHNQCKTNHCRSECKRECKQRIYEYESSGAFDSDQKISIVGQKNETSQSKHNITTIINLHNIINNTNLIDIPIQINNTNYNNITLSREDQFKMDYQSQTSSEELSRGPNGEKCCYVVGPRQCVKTNAYPFTKCFHYRHRRCAPFCIATIVHAQPQSYCDDSGCHKKVFYVPQVQPRCSYQQSWPYVNCGQKTFHNCHGCYDHQVNSHHHLRCARCHDNGFNNGPLYRQGPFYQPTMLPGYPGVMFGGYPSYFTGGFMGGFPGGFPGGMMGGFPGGMMGGYPGGMMGGYPGGFMGGFPGGAVGGLPLGAPGAGLQGSVAGGLSVRHIDGVSETISGDAPGGNPGGISSYYNGGYSPYPSFGFGQPNLNNLDDDDIIDADNEESTIITKSGDNNNESHSMLQYPEAKYVHETIIPLNKLNSSSTEVNDQSKHYSVTNSTASKTPTSRYALISIAAPKNHEKKEKRFKRKKDKFEENPKHDDKKHNHKASTIDLDKEPKDNTNA